ncbi:flagellar hook-length control protein FliK [Caloramator sp. E03]|uniref:flagellar hook-length control protein FliK n=1 Tax=Caloramator sp. E03 TaxID=2576307 RepID=UPI0011106709|nr:flagellar hook-length control protein FliK [Caloramator sp. E03]QCX34601.1 flagellar hook-length control protein FliK [Caloramator sp. E03]
MYIKNIEQLLNNNLSFITSIKKGSILYGKALADNELGNIIKLTDGTMLPAIFIEDNIEYNSFSKFEIVHINKNTLVLKQLANTQEPFKEDSINKIIKNLNIPSKDAKNIALTLLKFGLPASNENILEIYKNFKVLNSLNKDTINSQIQNEIVSLKSEITDEKIKEVLHKLEEIDINFLSFLRENDFEIDIENIIKIKYFADTFNEFNDFINFIDKNSSYSKRNFENVNIFFNKLVSSIKHYYLKQDFHFLSLSNALDIVNKDSNIYESLNTDFLKLLNHNLPILKQLNNMYNIFFFNGYYQNEIFKNSLIIKKKYKNSNAFDLNNTKIFISIDTPNLGTVESYIAKKNSFLSVKLKVGSNFTNLFNRKVSTLKENLARLGYNFIDISVEKLQQKNTLVYLSDFFNEFTFKELDVKV